MDYLRTGLEQFKGSDRGFCIGADQIPRAELSSAFDSIVKILLSQQRLLIAVVEKQQRESTCSGFIIEAAKILFTHSSSFP